MAKTQVYLRALTPEARDALGGLTTATVDVLPFRVGRESRHRGGQDRVSDDWRGGGSSPNNDLYLRDLGRAKYISREHFQLEYHDPGRFVVRDRGSVCGTMVGNTLIGGDRETGTCPIRGGSTIVLGGAESPYAFQFMVERGG